MAGFRREPEDLVIEIPSCLSRMEESAEYREPMTPNRWRSALQTLEAGLKSCPNDVYLIAKEIRKRIELLDAAMTEYCRATCPQCEDQCCLGLGIFFNRVDLLYLIALGEDIPPGQTRTGMSDTCRYLAHDGCRLPRTYRPYVCVWFLCDPQMEIFQQQRASFQRHFIGTLQEIRRLRLHLEALYEHHLPAARRDEL